jgi:hypothetical protein
MESNWDLCDSENTIGQEEPWMKSWNEDGNWSPENGQKPVGQSDRSFCPRPAGGTSAQLRMPTKAKVDRQLQKWVEGFEMNDSLYRKLEAIFASLLEAEREEVEMVVDEAGDNCVLGFRELHVHDKSAFDRRVAMIINKNLKLFRGQNKIAVEKCFHMIGVKNLNIGISWSTWEYDSENLTRKGVMRMQKGYKHSQKTTDAERKQRSRQKQKQAT